MFSTVVNGVKTANALATSLGKFGTVIVAGACHAVAQGALSMVQGGKFLTGATAGFLGHLGGEAWSNTVGNSDIGIIGFGALSGGIGAELTGGNFWAGAVIGGIVAGFNTALHSGLNHAMHQGDNYEDVDQEDPPAKKGTVYKISKEQLEQFGKPTEFGMGLMEYVEGGAPLKGVQWLNKMGRKYGPETIATVEKVGSKYWKYSAEVAGRNGRTVYTKYLNMEGKTVQWFHDTYNASNKFLHREFNAAGGRLKVLWDGTREYIRKF